MSEFLEKSKQSVAAAELLANENLYPSTVNRSYYACVQFLIHIVYTKIDYNFSQFYSDARNNKKGTHEWASWLVGTTLIKRDKDSYKWFQQKIAELKKLRVEADYYDIKISQEIAAESISRAIAIINEVKTRFK